MFDLLALFDLLFDIHIRYSQFDIHSAVFYLLAFSLQCSISWLTIQIFLNNRFDSKRVLLLLPLKKCCLTLYNPKSKLQKMKRRELHVIFGFKFPEPLLFRIAFTCIIYCILLCFLALQWHPTHTFPSYTLVNQSFFRL